MCSKYKYTGYGCKECTTETRSKFSDYCQITTQDWCDRCIKIDSSVYNSYGGSFIYEGELCFQSGLLKSCDNPDTSAGTCTKFNEGCEGCCLKVNNRENYCLRSEPDYESLCLASEEIATYNTVMESYSIFPLTVSLIVITSVIALLVLKGMNNPRVTEILAGIRSSNKSQLRSETICTISVFGVVILLCIIQISTCSQILCGPIGISAESFLVVSIILIVLFWVEIHFNIISKMSKKKVVPSLEVKEQALEKGEGIEDSAHFEEDRHVAK